MSEHPETVPQLWVSRSRASEENNNNNDNNNNNNEIFIKREPLMCTRGRRTVQENKEIIIIINTYLA